MKKKSVFRVPEAAVVAIWVVFAGMFIFAIFGVAVASPSSATVSPWCAAVVPGFAVAAVLLFIWLRNINTARRLVKKHMGIAKVGDGVSLFQEVRAHDRVNLQRALTHLHEADRGRFPVLGVTGDISFVLASTAPPTAVQWDTLPSSISEKLGCARNALYPLHVDDQPYCALIIPPVHEFRPVYRLEVFARSPQAANAALAAIAKTIDDLNVYRRAYITLERPAYHEDKFDVQFHEVPAVRRDEIILPDALLRAIERNTLYFLAQQEALRQAGQRTQRGLLFYGPPGTGKTLVTRYLASVSRCTIIILSGVNMMFIRDACQYARLLAPSMIVLEDIDLVAQSREEVLNNTVLHQLMESMDGLGPRSDCLFILTTNRPESLEQALASRPGRVDQAIHFPLPEVEERRRLFAQFTRGVDMSHVNLDVLLDRTKGAAPAFIQELVRKAALLALERGETVSPLPLRDIDFAQALREIALFGGDFTRRILGFQVQRDEPPLG